MSDRTDRSANIQEVAAKAGVSVATVSRALKSPERVAKKTREKVRAAVEALDYIPNAQARNLRTSKTGLVVALVPDISNPFFSGIIRGIEAVAKQNGYAVLLGDTQYEIEQEQRYGDMISGREADGLITLLPRLPRIRTNGRVPVVNVCETVNDMEISTIGVDNFAAMRDATRYLLALGHRSIAYVGGPPESPLSIDRRRGFDHALSEAGLTLDRRLCIEDRFSMEAGVRAANSILAYRQPVTAFLCTSDELAIGVMRSLQAHDIKIPGEISVVGFDDIAFARYTTPTLTTIAQPCNELGREAMLLLLQILNDPTTPARQTILPTQLVVRGSTGPVFRG